jgi:DNA repair protein RadC
MSNKKILLVTEEPFIPDAPPVAVTEISVSYKPRKNRTRVKIGHSTDAYKVLLDWFDMDTICMQEQAVILYLDIANRTIGAYKLSAGGVNNTIVDPRLVFSVALKCVAKNVILAHSHTCNLIPSKQDISLTKNLVEAGKLLDITVLDHIIINTEGYLSMSDEGYL